MVDDVEVAQPRHGALHVTLAGHVGEEDQPGLVTEADLLHRTDRHAVVTEHLGHGGQHAGTVGDVDVQVPGTAQVVGRAGCVGRTRGTKRAGAPVRR